MRNALASIAFAAASLMATPALADDFVFNVPVRIENADLIRNALVQCRVLFNAASAVGEISVDGQATVPITSGAYNGTVTVTITPPADARRADAHSWYCDLDVQFVDPPNPPMWWTSLTEAQRRARYTAASGRVVTSRMSAVAGFSPP